VNAIVLPLESNIPPGVYRLEIGLYDAATLERVRLADANGQPIGDKVVIESFTVVP
jgi:hypothetical protein